MALVYILDADRVLARQLEAAVGDGLRCEVRSFAALAGCLEAAGQRPPDGLLAAHEPGALPGLELAAALRETDPLLAVVIATHAGDADAAAAAVSALGPLAHVTKPIEPTELVAKLAASLERRRLIQQIELGRGALQQRDQALRASRREIERTTAQLRVTHSELETATERLVVAEELAAVGRVVAGIAHEISNQLALVGYAEAIKSRVEDPELAEFADIIASAQKRLAATVDEIRDFARGAAQIEREPAELGLAVDEALSILRYDRMVRARNIERDFLARPLVAIHRRKFSQVVINLMMNAVLATEPGDTLRVAIDRDRGAREAVLEVTDRGVGMSRQVLERLGEPFFTTRGERGSGLGVGICMRIVRDHGGSLSFESEPGAGTTATVRLPLLEVDE